ncbi:bifunctional phosphoribosyl-AMP cyclohydrolase/phosphoribosyl-ATP diphosphatase HisIE [Flocculibacter collagenilyticus]|uniref:bifunctional phosphoribosyl-AMP cyclohydrolase/phosphoribosyl-ATP diphosphatase HisIE n=1 Tax=Flocculibacter collagenilyticus TaxID=2744479 RepID=UPI0018F5C939|nr:bifunctional phosphoribosyl-AMP cyclohydrolase/phosphoribosyl-ATP diphosphatase HisIE [Flocculibacter collagenilyticus]
MLITTNNQEQLAWDKMNGLLPVIVQHVFSGQILMQGYMNRAALQQSLNTKLVTFFSRSKQRIWTKGEESGNTLALQQLSVDCDGDALIALVLPNGPTCHTGDFSCWHTGAKPTLAFIAELDGIISARKHAAAETSYTASLFESGIKRIAQKVGEEGVETALAATVQDLDELKNESADLLYHLLVLLQASDVPLADVIEVLQQRHQ